MFFCPVAFRQDIGQDQEATFQVEKEFAVVVASLKWER